MVKHLTMDDVDTMLLTQKVHLVVELNAVPVVTCVTTSYTEAKGVCVREENAVMLTLSAATIAKAKSGEVLEIVL